MKRSEIPCPRDPIGLSREESARYLGISPGHFDKLVREGAMPGPRQVGARKIWHAGELERAFLALPCSGNMPEDELHGSASVWDEPA